MWGVQADHLRSLDKSDLSVITTQLTYEVVTIGETLSDSYSFLAAVLTEHLARRITVEYPDAHIFEVALSEPLALSLHDSLGYGRRDFNQVLVPVACYAADGTELARTTSTPPTIQHWLTRLSPILGAEIAVLNVETREWDFPEYPLDMEYVELNTNETRRNHLSIVTE